MYGDGGSDHAPPDRLSRSAVISPRPVRAVFNPLVPKISPATPSICATPIFCVRFALSNTLVRCGFKDTFFKGDLKYFNAPANTSPLIRLPGILFVANEAKLSSEDVDKSLMLNDFIFCSPFLIASTDKFDGSISFRLPGVYNLPKEFTSIESFNNVPVSVPFTAPIVFVTIESI